MEGKLSCQGSTNAMLSAQSTLREIKRDVLQADWEASTTEASRHNSTAIASRIASDTSWMKLWDMALDYGPRGTDSLQALYRELTRPQFQPGICHLCGATMDVSYFHHYTLSLTRLSQTQTRLSTLFRPLLLIFSCMLDITSNLFMPCLFLFGLQCL